MRQALNNPVTIGLGISAWTRSVVLSHVVVGPHLSQVKAFGFCMAFNAIIYWLDMLCSGAAQESLSIVYLQLKAVVPASITVSLAVLKMV